jgi:hypothetical protein
MSKEMNKDISQKKKVEICLFLPNLGWNVQNQPLFEIGVE